LDPVTLCDLRCVDIEDSMLDPSNGKGSRVKRKRITSLGVVAGLLMLCAPAFAHRGGSDYDQQHPLTLKGTVTEFYWANPHVQVFMDVTDEKGKVVHWSVEAFAPAVLRRAGWTPQTLHAHDQITITFAPSRKGTPVGVLRQVVLADGRQLSAGRIGE
jgi:hypothetical protein